MKVTKHKRLYCYTQEKWLPKANKFDNFQDKKLRYVISDHILEEENEYEVANKQNVSIWQFFENNWFSPNFASVDDVVTDINVERLQDINVEDCYEEGIVYAKWRQFPKPDSRE